MMWLMIGLLLLGATALGTGIWRLWRQNQELEQRNERLRESLDDLRRKAFGNTDDEPQGEGLSLRESGLESDRSDRESDRESDRLRQYLWILDTLIDTIPNPIYYQDEAGIYQGCNSAYARELFGISRELLIGRRPEDFPDKIAPEIAAALQHEKIRMRQRKGIHTFEVEIKCANGRRREFWVSMAPVRNDAGEPEGSFIAVMQDLTEKNRAAREKAQKEKLTGVLETAGAVCHELNQPLQAIFGYAELLQGQCGPDDKHGRYVDKLAVQTERIAEITAKLQNITSYQTMAYADGSTIIDIHKASDSD